MAPNESPRPPADTSFEAIRERLDTEPGTLADFEAEYGPIRPPDGDQGLRCPEPSPDSSSDSARFGQPLPNDKGIEHLDHCPIFRDLQALSDFDKPR